MRVRRQQVGEGHAWDPHHVLVSGRFDRWPSQRRSRLEAAPDPYVGNRRTCTRRHCLSVPAIGLANPEWHEAWLRADSSPDELVIVWIDAVVAKMLDHPSKMIGLSLDGDTDEPTTGLAA